MWKYIRQCLDNTILLQLLLHTLLCYCHRRRRWLAKSKSSSWAFGYLLLPYVGLAFVRKVLSTCGAFRLEVRFIAIVDLSALLFLRSVPSCYVVWFNRTSCRWLVLAQCTAHRLRSCVFCGIWVDVSSFIF